MRYLTLGRTGLNVSKVGLGCGGHARLGQAYGKPESHGVALVRRAIDLGVNLIDTATSYGTETIVGKAIAGLDRSKLVIATKLGTHTREKRRLTAAEYAAGIDASLQRLGTDYADLYFIHGLMIEDYDYFLAELLPVMSRAREAGKVRFISVSEGWSSDPEHAMLTRALADDWFDVAMVGFNLLNPSARHAVFPITMQKRVGTLGMFVVRAALSKPDRLRELIASLLDAGTLSRDAIDPDRALDFLTAPGVAASIPEAAYRFGAHEPGVDVVLTGTGSAEHLEQNVRSILAGPLPDDVQAKLRELFSHVDSVSGN